MLATLSLTTMMFGVLAASPADSRYLDVVRRTVDTLLEHGLDQAGDQKSALIASMLDRTTLAPPQKMPSSPGGNRNSDRSVPTGSNVNLQQNLFRAMFNLSRMTGEARYAKAATAALVDFLRITQHADTGLVAWGEHLSWDLAADRAATMAGKSLIHEPKRKLLFFDLLYEHEPQRALHYARGLWEHQIGDQKTGDFSRHAHYDHHAPGRSYDFSKEASYFIACWSQAYERSRGEVFDHAVRVLAGRYLAKLNDHNLMDFDSTGQPGRADVAFSSDMLSLALESHAAAPRMAAATAAQLRELSARIDRGVLALPHAPADPQRGFVCYAQTSTGKVGNYRGRPGWSPAWGMGYGRKPTSMIALLCDTRQAQLETGPQADGYRRLVLAGADAYRVIPPAPQQDDLWPGEYGMAIFTELAALRLSNKPIYLDSARNLADQAIAVYWDRGAPLPRASSKTRHYEDITCADTLLLALLALHEHVAAQKPEVPISDLDR